MREGLRDYINQQGERLYNDLMFAAPETWKLHIQRRISEIIGAVEDAEDEEAAISD